MEPSTATGSSTRSPTLISRMLIRLRILAPIIDWCLALGLVVIVAMRYSRAIQQLRLRSGYDLEFHTNSVRNVINVKYPLFHYSTLWTEKLFSVPLHDAAYYVLLFYCGLTAILIHYTLRIYLKGLVSIPVTIALTASLMHITGLFLPSFHNQRLLGIGSPNTLHNPTTLALKPFAFLVTLAFWRTITASTRNRALVLTILTAILAILSVLAKPNFFLAFAAGAPIACFILFCFRRIRLMRLPIAAIPILAGVALLYLQWVATYQENQDGSGLMYAPLVVATFFHPQPLLGLLQLTAFPLAVVIWRPKIFGDSLFLLAVSTLIVSLVQYYLFAESGPRQFHANFAWGKDVCIAVLFPIVVGFAVRELVLHRSLKPVLATLLLPVLYFWHLWSGIEYFDHVMIYGQHTGRQSEVCIEYESTK
jgi:hypothetical protein